MLQQTLPKILGVLVNHASRNPVAGFPSEDRENGWFQNRRNTIPILSDLTRRSISWLADYRKNSKESTGYTNTTKTTNMGHLCYGYAAECPATVPVRNLVSPPMTWRWLALTEIMIVVDFINRVSEVLKARRVSRGYLGWTAWMPHAHWYGVPSLSYMPVCFLYLGCHFLIPLNRCMP